MTSLSTRFLGQPKLTKPIFRIISLRHTMGTNDYDSVIPPPKQLPGAACLCVTASLRLDKNQAPCAELIKKIEKKLLQYN